MRPKIWIPGVKPLQSSIVYAGIAKRSHKLVAALVFAELVRYEALSDGGLFFLWGYTMLVRYDRFINHPGIYEGCSA